MCYSEYQTDSLRYNMVLVQIFNRFSVVTFGNYFSAPLCLYWPLTVFNYLLLTYWHTFGDTDNVGLHRSARGVKCPQYTVATFLCHVAQSRDFLTAYCFCLSYRSYPFWTEIEFPPGGSIKVHLSFLLFKRCSLRLIKMKQCLTWPLIMRFMF